MSRAAVLRLAARSRGLYEQLSPAAVARLAPPYVRDRLRRGRYVTLDEAELLATKRSDTAVVFGSGRSLLEITPQTWERIARHDTIGFSEFVRQRFVRVDYHVLGEIYGVERYARLLRENPFYADTILIVQEGWPADDSNNLVGKGLLPGGARIFRYRRASRGAYAPPARSFREPLVHGWNSSTSVTNFALVMGYRRIVLAGIDLYDKRYFWLEPGERRDALRPQFTVEDPFASAAPIVDMFGRWRDIVSADGVVLEVLNPRSLLTRALPVCDPESL